MASRFSIEGIDEQYRGVAATVDKITKLADLSALPRGSVGRMMAELARQSRKLDIEPQVISPQERTARALADELERRRA